MDDWGFDLYIEHKENSLGIRTPEYDAQSSSPFGLGPNKKWRCGIQGYTWDNSTSDYQIIITLRLNNIP